MKRQIHFIVLAAAVATALGMPTARADRAAPTTTNDIENVIVTATKRSESLSEIPQSIQAISGERLANESVTSFSDIVAVVPGMSRTFKASPGFEVLQVRGITSGAVGDSLVGYYIDEIPFGLPNLQYIPPVNVFDVERVEVLRGPQGTLYGQSTMGGAIRLITQRPDLEKFSGEARLGYQSTKGGANGYNVDAVLNAPLSSTFGVRLSGGTNDVDSFIENTGKVKNHNGRLKALWAPSDELSVEGTAWMVRSRQTDYFYGRPSQPYQSITDPNEPRGVVTDVNIFNLTANYALPFADLVSASSYLDHKFSYVFALPGLRDLFPGAGQWLSTNAVQTKSFSQEIRLASRNDEGVQWIGGLFLQNAKLRATQEQGWRNYAPFNLGPSVWTAGDSRLESRSFGAFAEISRDFADDTITPTLGVRYFRDERTGADLRDATVNNAKRNFSSVNPRFNLAFKPVEGALYYLNVAKGFRSGAQQSQSAVTAATTAGLPASVIMPEDKLWSYEFGAKWSRDGISVETAIYLIDWKDAQLTNLLVGANGVTTTIISGGNDIKGKGIDFGLAWSTPVDGLSVQVAGNYNQTEFRRVPANTITRSGEQIPGAPKVSMTVAADYRRPVGSLQFSGHASYNYRGAQSELTTAAESDSVRDLRLRIGVGQEKWDVSIYGTNLTNQNGVAAILSALVVNPVQPRTIGIDTSFRF